MNDFVQGGWSIYLKIVLLTYVVSLCYVSEGIISPWLILITLLYISANMAIQFSTNVRLSFLLIAILIGGIVLSSLWINQLFILLLPVSLYELVWTVFRQYWAVVTLLFLPLYWIPNELMISYLFIAAISFVFISMLGKYAHQLQSLDKQSDQMRSELNQLKDQLEDHHEYHRQFEYTLKLEERNRLSQQIHDQVGHSMTGALIQMEAAKRMMDIDKEKSNELLHHAIQISKDGIEQIRQVLKSEKPLTEQLGMSRIRLLVEQFQSQTEIKVILTHQGNFDIITPIQWKIIYDNTVEALTNTMKYGEASIITIHIEVLPTFIKAVVADNGIGAPKVFKGLGIKGMEERTALVNGTVIIDGSQGFSVTTLIPYENSMRKIN